MKDYNENHSNDASELFDFFGTVVKEVRAIMPLLPSWDTVWNLVPNSLPSLKEYVIRQPRRFYSKEPFPESLMFRVYSIVEIVADGTFRLLLLVKFLKPKEWLTKAMNLSLHSVSYQSSSAIRECDLEPHWVSSV